MVTDREIAVARASRDLLEALARIQKEHLLSPAEEAAVIRDPKYYSATYRHVSSRMAQQSEARTAKSSIRRKAPLLHGFGYYCSPQRPQGRRRGYLSYLRAVPVFCAVAHTSPHPDFSLNTRSRARGSKIARPGVIFEGRGEQEIRHSVHPPRPLAPPSPDRDVGRAA